MGNAFSPRRSVPPKIPSLHVRRLCVYARLITRTKMYAYVQFSPPKSMCVFHVMRLPTIYFFKTTTTVYTYYLKKRIGIWGVIQWCKLIPEYK